MRIEITIECRDGIYGGLIPREGQTRPLLPPPDLRPEKTVEIKGHPFTLGQLAAALVDAVPADMELAFDEPGQLRQGQFLFEQLFGSIDLPRREVDDGEIRIRSDDPHILRLPWILLADDDFLCRRGWSVSLAGVEGQPTSCHLPPLPRLLVAAPQPPGVPKTWAAEHLDELDRLLSGQGTNNYCERFVRTVFTWEDWIAALRDFQPHLIYYYGHGIGDLERSALVFTENGRRADKGVSLVRQSLDGELEKPPLLVYLNCCQGDTGSYLGAGMQLRGQVPAVISNRTLADIPASRALALEFWKEVLLEGQAPHSALATIYESLYDLPDLDVDDPRWMTPVLHASYDVWMAEPLRAPPSLPEEPAAALRFDRAPQVGLVAQNTHDMIRTAYPNCYAYVWFGEEGQGVDLLHAHLRRELGELNEIEDLEERRPDWPPHLEDLPRPFEEMYVHAFDVDRVTQVEAQIRSTVEKAGRDATTVFYLRHQVLLEDSPIDLKKVERCLKWWDKKFAPAFEPPHFCILGICFVVRDAVGFEREVHASGLDMLGLKSTLVEFLPPLDDVGERDIFKHLRKCHHSTYTVEEMRMILEHVKTKGGGRYEPTLNLLLDVDTIYNQLD